MIQAKQELLAALGAAVSQLAPGLEYSAAFESPKQAAHGDFAITTAMQLSRSLKRNPRELAASLIVLLEQQPAVQRWVEALQIAGPGFINLRLKAAARQAIVREVLAAGDAYGHQAANGRRLMVEFVSANPTGPLHVGHGRQGALGDAICRLFESQGWQAQREFYYNDAGVQIATLAASTQARIKGLKPGDTDWPQEAYNGDYIADIAADFLAKKTVHADDRAFTASGNAHDIDSIRQFAVAYLRHEQDLDLQAFGVRFQNYFLESSLYRDGKVEDTVKRLVAAGKTYEKDGALWLKSTDYGDDKDRVMRKSRTLGGESLVEGGAVYTYFVPDVAYHIDKWQRGFDKVINVQGTDHHGSIARVRAGLQAAGVGIPPGWPDYVLNKMVTVMKGGQEVKISKRAGDYVTLRDLIDWTSRDAVRFFLISRKADTEFTFDVDLALKANDENPVFYVQYAHARICSVLARQQAPDRSGDGLTALQGGLGLPSHCGAQCDKARSGQASLAQPDLSLLTAPTEIALMRELAAYPDMLTSAATEMAPHDVAFYLRGLAASFHSYYAAERFLVDDPELAIARLALLAATRQVLRNALDMMGLSAPQAMAREVTNNGAEP